MNFVTGIAPHNSTQAALANASQVAAVADVLYGITINNTKASAQFIQLHDSATAPADTAVPIWCITIPASADRVIDFGIYGMAFANGIYVCNSSTSATKTIGSADCQFFARLNPQ